jgi:hypothetical protein
VAEQLLVDVSLVLVDLQLVAVQVLNHEVSGLRLHLDRTLQQRGIALL